MDEEGQDMLTIKEQDMLAIKGGTPVRPQRAWPNWPQYDDRTQAQLASVLENGRWAISGRSTGSEPKESEFARRWAAFNGVPYCVVTPNGTAGLITSLEALDIGAGDEVIVPGLTWVATATAVVNVNATPILVDVDPNTLCMFPDAVEAAITAHTRAIIPVHLYCCMADMDALLAIARKHHVAVIEDAAQAHGASWRGHAAGSLGDLGSFSMQQAKVLTAGEGGAVLTKDERLYERLQELRTDSRRLLHIDSIAVGDMQLVESGRVQGSNYCMSEFHAAILLAQLDHLEEQNRHREANGRYLDERLRDLGVRPLCRPAQMDKQTYYAYVARYIPDAFADRPVSVICRALQAELGFPVQETYKPLNNNPLYCPQTKRRYRTSSAYWEKLNPRQFALPHAEQAYHESFVFPHSILLGTRSDMDDIIEAMARVQSLADTLPYEAVSATIG